MPISSPPGWLGMMNMTLLNRSGLAAIAAVTALSSIPASAQDAAPVTESAPIVADAPLSSEPGNPPAADSDPLAPAATAAATTKRTTRAPRPARAAAISPRAVAVPRVAARPAPPAVAAATPVAPIEATADPAMVAPLPEVAATAPVVQAAPGSSTIGEMLPIAGAVGLGILGLAGAGFAMRRRRRDEDQLVEESWHEPAMSRSVEAAPPIVAPVPIAAAPLIATPALNWGNAPRDSAPSVAAAQAPARTLNRIEAAKRGPTPDNPSRSLKKRLSRAAFFDQRDRMVAAGKAAPVSAMAGLPKSLARQPEAQPRLHPPVARPDPAMRMSFNRSFQPA